MTTTEITTATIAAAESAITMAVGTRGVAVATERVQSL